MFTSKKAQYLTNNFERISPITNIDSLYYEQVQKTGTKYKVERQSVVKHMPIQCDTSLCVYNKQRLITYNHNSAYSDITQLNLHINTSKNMLYNPYDEVINKFLYDTSLFEIYSPGILDLCKIFVYYETVDDFYLKTTKRVNEINILNTSINNTSIALDNLNTRLYGNVLEDQHIGTKRYKKPLVNVSIGESPINSYTFVNIQDVSVQNQNLSTISLDSFAYKGALYVENVSYLNHWTIEYDPNFNKLTYLIDDFNNEGSYNFREEIKNMHTTYYSVIEINNVAYRFDVLRDLEIHNNSNCIIKNNKIIGKNGDVIFQFQNYFNTAPNDQKVNVIGNNFIRSKRTYVSLKYNNLTCSNNTITNSTNVNLTCTNNNKTISNNTVLNSSNFVLDIRNGNNNTIINCIDSSIKIIGNNNFIANVKNASIIVGSNNVIINDSSYNSVNNDYVIQNCNAFLDDSLKMLNYEDTYENITVFGSSLNKIDVYYDGIHSLNDK